MNRPPYGIVEVTYDPVRELRRGLLEYRNQFCDVRLWVENHAIPAHKLILSLHSTFFQQMFKSDSESASDVYLNEVRYNVLYPIIEFMYTGRAHIDSTNVLDEIKAFSQSINFRPFTPLWNAEPQTMPLQVTEPPDNNSGYAVSLGLSPNQPMTPIPYISASTQVTPCFPAAQMSSSFAPPMASTPELASTPAPTINIPAASVSSSPTAQRFLEFAQSENPRCIPTTLSRADDTSALSSNSNVISPSPQTTNDRTLSHHQSSPIPVERRFFGFSPADVQNYLPITPDFKKIQAMQPINLNDSPMESEVMAKTSSHSTIELSDTSPTSQHDCGNNVIEIVETDVEIVENSSQVPIIISSDTEFSTSEIKIDRINENVAKPKARRGRPKKIRDTIEANKIFVSTRALFKKKSPAQRGRKRKIN